jgi:hypothetical protein
MRVDLSLLQNPRGSPRVENTIVVVALSSPRTKDAWAEVEHRGLNRNHDLGLTCRVMFGDLARHYIKDELRELTEADVEPLEMVCSGQMWTTTTSRFLSGQQGPPGSAG